MKHGCNTPYLLAENHIKKCVVDVLDWLMQASAVCCWFILYEEWSMISIMHGV